MWFQYIAEVKNVLKSSMKTYASVKFSHSKKKKRSVTQSCLTLRSHEHARPPYPSPTPGVHSNSCPLSRWCHPAISSTVIPFSSCLQSFPALESFPMSQFFSSGDWVWSFSFSISPSNEYSGLISFRMDWLDLLTAQVILKSLLQHHSSYCAYAYIVKKKKCNGV